MWISPTRWPRKLFGGLLRLTRVSLTAFCDGVLLAHVVAPSRLSLQLFLDPIHVARRHEELNQAASATNIDLGNSSKKEGA
jgi:hypothetical protein